MAYRILLAFLLISLAATHGCGDEDEPTATAVGESGAGGAPAKGTGGSGGASSKPDAGDPTPPTKDAGGGADEDDAGATAGEKDPEPPALDCASDEMACDGRCVPKIEATLDDLHLRIVSRTCALSDSCHTGDAPKEGLDLTTTDSLLGFVGKPSAQFPSLSVIEAGKPEDSYLIRKLRGVDIADKSSTGTRATSMPPPPTRALCDEKIRLVEKWIRDGAKP